ncbi:MAG: hypothetical protein AAGD96_10445 [Chloroflexota bacterium]
MSAGNKSTWKQITDILLTPFEGVNRFILSDLREGRLSLVGMSYPVKSIVRIGFVILLIANLMVLIGDPFRQSSVLLAINNTGRLLRGANLPSLALPFTLFLFVLSWGFLLSGTIRAARWLKWGILIIFYISLVPQWVASTLSLGLNLSIGRVLLAGVSAFGLAFIPIYSFVARRMKTPMPILDFSVMFVSSAFALNVLQIIHIGGGTLTEESSIAIQLHAYFAFFFLLVYPFVIQLGMEIAKFVLDLGFWSAEIIQYRFARRPRAIYVGLALLTIIQLNAVIRGTIEYFQATTFWSGLLGYIGSGMLVAAVWLVWWLIERRKAIEFRYLNNSKLIDRIDEMVAPIILLMISIPILALTLLLFYSLTTVPVILLGLSDTFLKQLLDFVDYLNGNNLIGVFLASAAALIWGIVELWRNRPLRANYLFLFSFFFLWKNVTRPGHQLEIFNWTDSVPLDFWWSVLLLGFILIWLRRRELTTQRAISLLILTVINTLVFRQTDFIEDPFYRILEFSGTGLIVFGILWDVVTIGHWANEDTPALPRQSRIFLYLGYVMLSVAVIYWAIAQHDHFWINQFTGDGALAGLSALGQPMLYMLFPLLLMLPKGQSPLEDPTESQSGAVTDSPAAA